MNSFGEVRTCLVLMFSALLIVTTSARFIYQPDTILSCREAQVPCSGQPSEGSCRDHCVMNGYADGKCDGFCCLCFAGPVSDAFNFDQRTKNQNPFFRPPRHLPRFLPNPARVHQSRPRIPPIPGQLPNKMNIRTKPTIIADELDKEDKVDKSILKTSPICTTRECVKNAYRLIMNLDESVDPCDDFYQFACGNFEKTAVVPDDKAELTLIGDLTEKLHLQVRSMIEGLQDTDTTASSQLVKDLYSSCMNVESLEQKGVKPLLSLLEKAGGWPVLLGDKWQSKENFDWTELVLKLREMGLGGSYLVSVGVGVDVKNPGKRMITIGEPSLSFKREQLLDHNLMAAHNKFQIDLASLLGVKGPEISREMGSILKFERSLANISLPREAARGHPLNFYHPMTISELQQRFPQLNWLHFIRKWLPESLGIQETEVVSVSVPSHLANLLRIIETTDQRTLTNYIMWRAASSLIPYLGEAASMLRVQFTAKITGQVQKPPKSVECIGLVTGTLGHAVGKMYVEKYFNEHSRKEAIKLFKDIHQEFDSILEESTWMDPLTKKKAHDKVKAMKSYAGYPEELMQEDKLMELYKGLILSKNDFFGNVLNITKSALEFTNGKLRDPIDPNDWIPHGKPAVVNAFYSPMHNFIQFPAGILQGHFFSPDRPHYMQFSAIGWVYGHELIHGFDDQGSHFDLKGELADWWHPQTKQRYREKTQCIVQQYSKYSFTDLVKNSTTQLNGAISQGENIADNGGIKLAYRAYQKWVKQHGEEHRLPGLEKFSPNQLFWITSTNNWCSKHRSMALHHHMKTGVHPPGRFRVIGSLSNSQEFAKDFQCPVGSRMNPKDKCSVW